MAESPFAKTGRMRAISGAWVADSACVVGDVTLGADSNIWFHSVVRADDAAIRIGRRTNIQDATVIHPEPGDPMEIGEEVTVGHRALLHGRKIGDRCLIGMGAILLGWSEIGEECIVGAGALILEKTVIPPRSLVVGSPGRIVREVKPHELVAMRQSAQGYVDKVKQYLR